MDINEDLSSKVSKVCKWCEKEKFLHEFNKQSKAKDGHKQVCRVCDKNYNKNRYRSQHIEIKEKIYHWQQNNRLKVRQYKQKYYRKSLKRYGEETQADVTETGHFTSHSPEGQN